jgi:poly(3-hydroxybutyrate) depolymerase
MYYKPPCNLIRLLVAFFSLLMASDVQSQTNTPRSVSINSNCKGYMEYLPADYPTATTKKYPTIIYIHGGASFGAGTTASLTAMDTVEGVPLYIAKKQFPASIVTPYGDTASFIAISPQFIRAPSTPTDVKAVIDYVLAHYRVDLNRLYLTGYSLGGNAVWQAPYNLAQAQRLAAMVPVAGYNSPYYDTTAQFIAGANVPVWAIHSTADQTALIAWSVNMVAKINSYSPPIPAILTKLTTQSHDSTVTAAYNPLYRPNGKNIYEWMLQYARYYPPIANAGKDTSVVLPVNSVKLSGTASTDRQGQALTYLWSKVSGPNQFSISSTTAVNPVISGLIAGKYNFNLTVTNTAGLSATSSVTIYVIGAGAAVPPVANAGKDTAILFPQTSAILNAGGSTAPNGAIQTYTWTQLSGRTQATITAPGSVTTTVSNLKPGIYQFGLTITDNLDSVGRDTVQVNVVNPFPNKAPIARAGVDQTITVPTNSITVNGSASSDTDGIITSYRWRQLNGPSQSSIGNSNQASTTVSNMATGIYQFELAVQDDSSAIGRDTLIVFVNPQPKLIQVNVYGGTTPAGTGWNNWNVAGSLSATALKYADGTASTVKSVLSASNGVADNGAGYPTTMCPVEVGRTSSYFYNAARTLVLSGLNNSSQYNFEAYASRLNTSTNSTYTIGSNTASVQVNNNYANKASFTGLTTSNGSITVTINGTTGSYNYFNGFTLTEIGQASITNKFPIANAGADQTINLPTRQVTVNGSGSSDPDGSIASYDWQQVSGPANATITNPTAVSTAITGLDTGTYVFQLTVTDNQGAVATSILKVSVGTVGYNNMPPVANAGPDQTIYLPTDSTLLDASASRDPDGTIAKYSWSKIAGPAQYKISNPAIVNPSIGGLFGGVYQFELTVTDNTGVSTKDTVAVRVTSMSPVPPVANAGTDILLSIPTDSTVLNGYGSYDKMNYPVTYSWSKVSGPSQYNFNDSTLISPRVSHLTGGTYIFQLTVSDTTGLSGIDSVTVTIKPNLPPVAAAGNYITLTLPANSVQLDGSGSNDPDGSIASYRWSELSGPTIFSINDSTVVKPSISNLTKGVYVIVLNVTDSLGATGSDTLVITVYPAPNTPPTANAGPDRTIFVPDSSAALNGSASKDNDGVIVSYHWVQLSGPSTSAIGTPDSASTNAGNLTQGVYNFELTVTDDSLATGKDTVVVTVKVNQPPTAAAGNDIYLTLPTNAVQLNGSGSYDPDGTIASYRWSEVSGPSAYTISDSTAIKPNISNLTMGVYVIALAVTDSLGAASSDTVLVTVYPPRNQPPIANAGPDQTIILPANTAVLNGSASKDNDGVIKAWHWRQVSGPSTSAIDTPDSVSANASGLIAGTYSFELSVTDDSLATVRDTMNVTVNTGTRLVKVNTYGGSFPAGTGWNNWNVSSKLSSGTLFYSDGSSSTISAVLSANDGVADNGAGYPTTMCPTEVGRTSCYCWNVRTLTLSGLDNSKKYNFELYSSRTSAYPNAFTIGSTSITLDPTKNYSNKAVWNNITPSSGQIIVTLFGSYNYLNGFTLTENASAGGSAMSGSVLSANEAILQSAQDSSTDLIVFPNPFRDQVQVQINNASAGQVTINLLDQSGRILKKFGFTKAAGVTVQTLPIQDLPVGSYYIQVRMAAWTKTIMIIKQRR